MMPQIHWVDGKLELTSLGRGRFEFSSVFSTDSSFFHVNLIV